MTRTCLSGCCMGYGLNVLILEKRLVQWHDYLDKGSGLRYNGKPLQEA